MDTPPIGLRTDRKEKINMSITQDFSAYFESVSLMGSDKKKIPSGTYGVDIIEFNCIKSKSGNNAVKWKAVIDEVKNIKAEADPDKFENDATKLLGRAFSATDNIEISSKNEFIAGRWTLIASEWLGKEAVQKIYEDNKGNELNDYVYDLALAIQKASSKKKIFKAVVEREIDGEYFKSRILPPLPEAK